MNPLPLWAALARADFLERSRRPSFFLSLLLPLSVVYGIRAGNVWIGVGDSTGVFNSAWIGTVTAAALSCLLTLVGFYLVKGGVERDRASGVGEILATTPLTKLSYLTGKALSNLAFLTLIVLLLAIVSGALLLWDPPLGRVEPWKLLSPFLLLTLPAVSLVAGISVFFEVAPGLRRGFGNVFHFFVWAGLLSVSAVTRCWFDWLGLNVLERSLLQAVSHSITGPVKGMSFQIGPAHLTPPNRFVWNGIGWGGSEVLARLCWPVAAMGVVLAGGILFDRFDLSRRRSGRSAPPTVRTEAGPTLIPSAPRTALRLPALLSKPRFDLAWMLRGELRLLRANTRWYWAIGVLVLWGLELFLPRQTTLETALPVAWLWPVLVWSGMGTREKRFGTMSVIASTAHAVRRQTLSGYLAGVLVAVGMTVPLGLRLAAAGQLGEVLACCAGWVFIPALALLLGVATGTPRAFEGVFTALWYVGALQHAPPFDFTRAATAPFFATLGAAFLALALAWRR